MFAVRDATFGPDFEALVEQLLKRSHHRLLAELDRLLMLVRHGGAAAIAPFVALLAVLGVWSGAFDWLHIDTHVQRGLLTLTPPVMSGPVLIAAIDADSERRLERHWDDLSQVGAWRRGHALVIDRAAAAGARAVVFDLAFDCRRPGDPCEPAPLDAIAAAARRAAQRHPPMNVVFAVRSRGAAGPDIATPLRGVGSTGAACLNNRGDGALWSVPLAVLRGDAGGRDVVAADTPALAVAALVDAPLRSVDLQRRVMAFDGPPRDPPLGFSAIERRRDPLPGCPLIAHDALEAALLLRPAPAGHWRTPARQLSYGDLLAARAMEAVLADRIVLVGATALTRPDANKDVHAVQEGLSTRLVYGVELHADAIATLATGRVPRLPGVGLQLAVALVASVAGAVIALVGHYWAAYRRLSTLFAIAAVWVGVCVVLARNDWLMNPGYDLAALLLAYVALRVLQWLARAILLRREA
jgi:CHASE2 domain-containing sensor protein